MSKLSSAIFLDRDGTINVDCGYLYEIEKFKFIEGSINAMYELKKMGYLLIIITNQSGIAFGKFTQKQFENLTNWMKNLLDNYGVNLDGIYYCPHHPDGIVKKYCQLCCCKKPKAGMLRLAQEKFQISMQSSFMVGDKLEDIQAAKEAKIGTKVLVRTGKFISNDTEKAADLIIDSLAELPKKIKELK